MTYRMGLVPFVSVQTLPPEQICSICEPAGVSVQVNEARQPPASRHSGYGSGRSGFLTFM